MTKQEMYFGIDIGKTWLDVANFGGKEVKRFHNDEVGISELMNYIQPLQPEMVVVEATGGYEQQVVEVLNLKGYRKAVINPTRIRAYAKAIGLLAKTDTIDARLIAEYAYKVQPEPQESKNDQEIRLKALVTRREQLVELKVMETNRLGTTHPSMKADIREHLDWLATQISILEAEIKELAKELPKWGELKKSLLSIPGVGMITAITIMAEMPEIGGDLNRQQIVSLAGLAPFNQDSGKKKGKRRIFGGRKGIRRVLYMACLSAIKHNPVIKALYERLIQKGKVFKVAITACMRKLLTIMNVMVKNKSVWSVSG
jgi:transposase